MRIGLIAMSGVRVYNQKLIEVGVTLPQFVNRGQVIAQLPSLALLLLAAATPDDIADVVVSLARTPFATGQVVVVDGGLTLT